MCGYRSPKGQPLVISEIAQREPLEWTTQEFVNKICERDRALGLAVPMRGTFCDPAGQGVEAQTGESQFRLFQQAGLAPIAKKSSIRDGCVRFMDSIAHPEIPLLVSKGCPWLCEAIGAVSPDRRHPDVYDEGSAYTHVLDAMRYFYVNQPLARGEERIINYADFPEPVRFF